MLKMLEFETILQGSFDMQASEIKTDLKKFIKDLLINWEERNSEKLSLMYSKNVVGYMDDKVVGYKDIMNRLQFSIDKFKEVSNEVQDVIVEGEKVVARIKQTLMPRIDGKPTIYHIIAIYRIVDDQVLETWSSFYPNVNYLNNN